ncbi:MAG: thioredoxin reductase [Mesorhizobium amorphae]|nr:MAG: thioredoxin reductase [Mesorhizobium amorphae]
MAHLPAETDVLIVGAGPAGLFAAFQLGLFGIRSHLVDALNRPGGQCAAFYPDKPIYDIPGHPEITGDGLIGRLMAQIAPFAPGFSLGRAASSITREPDARFGIRLETDAVLAQAVVLATGTGSLVRNPAPLAGWGIGLDGDRLPADTARFESAVPGIFAVGDAASYPGKLPLILSAFHEAALMAQAVRALVRPGERRGTEHTSTSRALQGRLGKGVLRDGMNSGT